MNQEQFVATFRSHLPSVSKYLVRRIDRSQVEDLASEIFEIAWKKKADCPEGMELAWLYKIAGYVLANHKRKQANRIVHLPFMDHDLVAPSAEDMALNGSSVATAFAALGPVDRQVLSLLVFEELSVTEISVVLEISANSASQRIKRARARLAENLSKKLSDI